MKAIRVIIIFSICLAFWACGGSGGQQPAPPPAPSITSVTVSSSANTMWVALDPLQFSAIAHYSDGTTKDVTASATWSSSSPSTATVSSAGLATPVAAGTANIQAATAGVTGRAAVTVVGIAGAYMTPSGPVLSLAGSPTGTQLSSTVMWADGKTKDVTADASWLSSDASIATVNSTGYVGRGGNAGYATVTGSWKSLQVSTAVSVTTKTMSAANLSGNYAFLLHGVDSSGPAFYTGIFTADGIGVITGQMTAATKEGTVATPAPFTGTYAVFPDGRGDMTIVPSAPFSATPLRFVLGSNGSQGRAILFDPLRTTAMTGVFQKQASAAFDNSTLQGSYVFKFGGADAQDKFESIVGMLTTDGAGQIVSGVADLNDDGVVNNGNGASVPLPVTGSYTLGADGQGSMTLNLGSTPYHFAMTVISNNLFRLLCTDSGQHLLGQVELQQVPTGGFQSMDGNYTFLMENGGRGGVFGMGGRIEIGPMTAVSGWTNMASSANYAEAEITQGTRNMTASGRGTLDLQMFVRTYVTSANYSFAVYMVSPTRMYWIETDAQPSVLAGLAQGESSGSLNGSYIYMGGALNVASGTESSVLALLDANTTGSYNGLFSGIADVNLPGQTPGTRMFGSSVADGIFNADTNSLYQKWNAQFPSEQGTVQNFNFYINSNYQAVMFGQTTVADNPNLDGWISVQ